MTPQISAAAGEIWLEIDRGNGAFQEILLGRLENPGRSRELLLMALGWLIYQGHVRWASGDWGGRLHIVSRNKEELLHEESNKNRFAAHGA